MNEKLEYLENDNKPTFIVKDKKQKRNEEKLQRMFNGLTNSKGEINFEILSKDEELKDYIFKNNLTLKIKSFVNFGQVSKNKDNILDKILRNFEYDFELIYKDPDRSKFSGIESLKSFLPEEQFKHSKAIYNLSEILYKYKELNEENFQEIYFESKKVEAEKLLKNIFDLEKIKTENNLALKEIIDGLY